MDEPVHRKRLRRIEHPHHLRFLTFSCFARLPLFKNDLIKDAFASHLEATRSQCEFGLYAWVVMPNHVHIVLWPRLPQWPMSRVLLALKRPFAKQVIARWRALGAPILKRLTDRDGRPRFWLPGGGYDRNEVSLAEAREKIRYVELNPVRAGLVKRPEEWAWSSARWWAGDRTGPVQLSAWPPRKPGCEQL